jgi:large subunit ribosomal protein L1
MAHKRSPKYLQSLKKIDQAKTYLAPEALNVIIGASYVKFDETIDVAFNLGVDPRHADQMIRGALVMPSGTGKVVRVLVIASGDKVNEAEKAGADYFGGDDIITKISGGWLDFDRVIATPDMMGKIGKIGKLLGPKGLMPNPKLGTVTMDVSKAVNEQKMGKVEYRTDKTGIIHVPIGKKSFGVEKLLENYKAIASALMKAKPASSKGSYLKSIYMSSSMGPGVRVDTLEAMNLHGH